MSGHVLTPKGRNRTGSQMGLEPLRPGFILTFSLKWALFYSLFTPASDSAPPPSSDRPHGWQPLPSYAMQSKQPEKDWILLTALVPKLPRLTWMGCPFLGSSSVSRTIMGMALYQVAMRPSSPSMEPRRVTKKASLQKKELGRKLKSWPLWLECDKCAYRQVRSEKAVWNPRSDQNMDNGWETF